MGLWEDFFGTTSIFFRIGKGGPGFKNNSGAMEVRNNADTAYSSLRVNQVEIESNGNIMTMDAVANLAANTIVRFPGKSTDGFGLFQKAGTPAGELEFELKSVPTSTDKVSVDTTDLAFGSGASVALFQLPANAVVDNVAVVIDTPFNNTPSLTVGVSGTPAKYMTSQQVDLTSPATTIWRANPGILPNASAENLIATFSAGGATVGAARILVKSVVPI